MVGRCAFSANVLISNPISIHEWINTNVQCLAVALEQFKRGRDILRSPDFEPDEVKTEHLGCRLNL